METIRVLSTKKLLPEIVEEAKENGIEITEQEAIAVHPILKEEKQEQLLSWFHRYTSQPIVFTSANAVSSLEHYLGKYLRGDKTRLQVFCLSGRTKEAVLEAFPIANIAGVAPSARALAKLILAKGINEVFFFCGNKRRDELPGLLKQNGAVAHEIVVYETVSTPCIATEEMDAILFFSPSAADSFFSVNQPKKNIICFAVGETTADSILKYSGNTIIISDTPSQEGMLKALIAYKNLNTHPDN
jgi:uroporphyrinogen-III synthase